MRSFMYVGYRISASVEGTPLFSVQFYAFCRLIVKYIAVICLQVSSVCVASGPAYAGVVNERALATANERSFNSKPEVL